MILIFGARGALLVSRYSSYDPRNYRASAIHEADLSYLIILCSQGRLVDGMHRVAKEKLLGKEGVLAVQFEMDPEPDFINVNENDLIYDVKIIM
ncbi:hypothetical protein [Entomomonas moraniae]|uniref:hypothetical protein n=1 Tax=Entomomonas moraniae TaxID=2213226 RepID=UPI001E421430|nr:hypothetical protein [Entomomonas moraniae]